MSQKSFRVIRKHSNRGASARGSTKDRAGHMHRMMALRASDERFQSEVGRAPLGHAEVFQYASQGEGAQWRRGHVVRGAQQWVNIAVLPPLSLDCLPALEQGIADLEKRAAEWASRYGGEFIDHRERQRELEMDRAWELNQQAQLDAGEQYAPEYVPEHAWPGFWNVAL